MEPSNAEPTTLHRLRKLHEYHVHPVTESVVEGRPPCRRCGATDRVNALGWGERCGPCGAHGIDLDETMYDQDHGTHDPP